VNFPGDIKFARAVDCGENLRHDAAGSIPKTGSESRGIRSARYVPRAARNREIKTMNNARPSDSRRVVSWRDLGKQWLEQFRAMFDLR